MWELLLECLLEDRKSLYLSKIKVMYNNRASLKNNQPELLVDFNGNAVQHAWMLGGRTIAIEDGSSFVAESTLMRVCNSGDSVVRLKLDNVDYDSVPHRNGGEDVGLPILPNSVVVLGVYCLGQKFNVSGGDIDVTFVYDRRTKEAEPTE